MSNRDQGIGPRLGRAKQTSPKGRPPHPRMEGGRKERCPCCARMIGRDALSSVPVFAWHFDESGNAECVGTHRPFVTPV